MTRIALVIGPSREMNDALRERLAKLGYEPIVISVDEKQNIASDCDANAHHHIVHGDGDSQPLHFAMEKIVKERGCVDVCISHAVIPFELMAKMVTQMTQAAWGRIVEIESANAGLIHGASNEETEHHFRRQQIKTLALQCAIRGVTINTIVTSHAGSGLDGAFSPQRASARLSTAEEIAGLAAYLVSDEASFLNGARIVFNTGRRLA